MQDDVSAMVCAQAMELFRQQGLRFAMPEEYSALDLRQIWTVWIAPLLQTQAGLVYALSASYVMYDYQDVLVFSASGIQWMG